MGNNSVKVELKGLEMLAAPSPQIKALINEMKLVLEPIQKMAKEYSQQIERLISPIKEKLSKLKPSFKSIFQEAIRWAKSKITWRFLTLQILKQIPILNPIPKWLWIPKNLFFTFSRKLHAPPACLPINASSRTLTNKA